MPKFFIINAVWYSVLSHKLGKRKSFAIICYMHIATSIVILHDHCNPPAI